jgi:hypothetical protein
MGNQFKTVKNLYYVQKGEPLAHLFVTKHGKAGVNIFGEEVHPDSLESQFVEQYLGENVSYSLERGQVIADKSGYPYMDELSRIHIKHEFKIDKNLDLSTGDIEFSGSLVVQGDIIDKIKLKLTGDLTVYGDINDAEIEVKGNIVVEGDILDCKSPGIFSAGTVTFNSAENSKIVAGEKIHFKKSIQFCKIVAENGVYGKEDSSTIVGGICNSGEHIETAVIGNTGSIGTEIEITISPYTKECMLNLTKQMLRLKELSMEDTPEYHALHDELGNLEIKLENEINNMLKNQDNLPKHILAFKKVFPGTYIRILKKSMLLSEEKNRVSFSIINGELTNETY